MTRSALKTSRTGSRRPFQILADYYQTGDTCDGDLWHEYSRLTRGLASVRWSRGLRAAILGPSAVPERADHELATDDANGALVTQVSLASWSAIRLAGLDHALLVAAETRGEAAAQSVAAAAGQRPAK